MNKKFKLKGRPDKTVTWIWLENGQLKVEYYDFSEDAQQMFGNDIAYGLTVTQMEKLYLATNQSEPFLIDWIQKSFGSYFEIKAWLEKNKIEFEQKVDPWA